LDIKKQSIKIFQKRKKWNNKKFLHLQKSWQRCNLICGFKTGVSNSYSSRVHDNHNNLHKFVKLFCIILQITNSHPKKIRSKSSKTFKKHISNGIYGQSQKHILNSVFLIVGSTFGHFWVLLGTFGYFWVLLGTFGYFWVLLGRDGLRLGCQNLFACLQYMYFSRIGVAKLYFIQLCGVYQPNIENHWHWHNSLNYIFSDILHFLIQTVFRES